jgi:hypothetical protein
LHSMSVFLFQGFSCFFFLFFLHVTIVTNWIERALGQRGVEVYIIHIHNFCISICIKFHRD